MTPSVLDTTTLYPHRVRSNGRDHGAPLLTALIAAYVPGLQSWLRRSSRSVSWCRGSPWQIAGRARRDTHSQMRPPHFEGCQEAAINEPVQRHGPPPTSPEWRWLESLAILSG